MKNIYLIKIERSIYKLIAQRQTKQKHKSYKFNIVLQMKYAKNPRILQLFQAQINIQSKLIRQMHYCYTEGKPETLVLLRNQIEVTKILTCSQRRSFLWLSQKNPKALNIIKDIQAKLQEKIQQCETFSDLKRKLGRKNERSRAVLIASLQFKSQENQLKQLGKFDKIYFYKDEDEVEDTDSIKGLRQIGLFNPQQKNNSQSSNEEISSISSMSSIWKGEQDQLVEEVLLEPDYLFQKLVNFSGPLQKVFPNFILVDKEVRTSDKLFRTMLCLVNQPVDASTARKINEKLKILIQQIQKIDPKMRTQKSKEEKQGFLKFLESTNFCQNKQIIQWYTKETFVYKLINNLLRAHRNPTEIYYLQPYLKRLFQAIKQMHTEQISKNKKLKFVCYRGGRTDKKEFQLFKNNIGNIIQSLGFLSTSLNETIAEGFKKKGEDGILFQIEVDQTSMKSNQFGFAEIGKESFHSSQEEVLFNPLNIFQIIEAKQVAEEKGGYKVKLRYRSQGSKKNRGWDIIIELQKSEAVLNYCQGNALVNECYNLEEGNQYWQKYINLIGNSSHPTMKLKRAYGLFNKNYYQYMRQILENQMSENKEVFQCLFILNQLFGRFHQIVVRLQVNMSTLKLSQNSRKLSQSLERDIKAMTQYIFFQRVSLNRNSFIKKGKYKLTERLDLRNLRLTNQHFINQFQADLNTSIRYVNLYGNRLKHIPECLLSEQSQIVQLNLGLNSLNQVQKIGRLKNLEKLDLSLNSIEIFLPGQGQLKNLKYLDLSGNQLRDIQISQIKQLQFLNLSINNFQEVPLNIMSLTQLKQLHIGRNKLKTLPQQISSLLNLLKLMINQNLFQYFPVSIVKLNILEVLDVSSNQLKDLPSEISQLAQLKKLNLQKNPFQKIPQVIFQLQNLSQLNISSTKTQKIQPKIEKLTKLQRLYASDNYLKTVPSSLSQLTNLIQLDLQNNQIETLPPLQKLKKLRKIRLKNNLFTKISKGIFAAETILNIELEADKIIFQYIPVLVQKLNLTPLQNFFTLREDELILSYSYFLYPNLDLKTVKQVYLKNNKLQQIPLQLISMPSLKRIDLSNNFITTIPQNLNELIQLQVLVLQNNQIRELCDNLTKVNSLLKLYLKKNRLVEISKKISGLVKLKELDVSGNLLQRIPSEIFQLLNLRELCLSSNKLKQLPKISLNSSKLQKLDLSSNKLQRLPEEIQCFTNLEVIQLKSNEITDLPKGIYKLKKLSILSFDNLDLDMIGKLQGAELMVRQSYGNKKQIFSKLIMIKKKYNPFSSQSQLLENFSAIYIKNYLFDQLFTEIHQICKYEQISLKNDDFSSVCKQILQITNSQNLHFQSSIKFPFAFFNKQVIKKLLFQVQNCWRFPSQFFDLIQQEVQSATLTLNKFDKNRLDLRSKNQQLVYRLSFKQLKAQDYQQCYKQVLNLLISQKNRFENHFLELKDVVSHIQRQITLDHRKKGKICFPKQIIKLTKIREMNLSGNNLEEIPCGIQNFKQLNKLNINENKLNRIPNGIQKLQNLRQLMISSNQIKELSEEDMLKLQKIQTLDMSKNEIVTFMGKVPLWQKTRQLDLSKNKLQILPFQVSELPKLVRLNISYNKFKNLKLHPIWNSQLQICIDKDQKKEVTENCKAYLKQK